MIKVSAGIVIHEGNVLICQRNTGGQCVGLWEFPGGKQENGETETECLCRECSEELSVTITARCLFNRFTWRDAEKEILFSFFLAEIAAGEAQCLEHQAIRWVQPSALHEYTFCPADATIIPKLQLYFSIESPPPKKG